MSGIIGYGVYVPKYRIKQQDIGIPWGSFGMGEKAVCGWDEDIISMAAEAVDNAVKHSGVKAADIGALYMGTASSHMVEMHLSPILAELLGLSPHAYRAGPHRQRQCSGHGAVAVHDGHRGQEDKVRHRGGNREQNGGTGIRW